MAGEGPPRRDRSTLRVPVLVLAGLAPPCTALALTLAPAGWSPLPVDPAHLFDPEALASWQAHAGVLRMISLGRTATVLTFLLLLVFSPLGRGLHGRSERLAQWFTGRLPSWPTLQRIGQGLARLFGDDWASALLFAYAFFGLRFAVLLPFGVAAELEQQAEGLSRYTPSTYLWDLLKAETLAVILFAFLVFGLFGLIRRLPRFWWLFLGLPTGLLLFGYGVVAPYRARVFDDFRPLEAMALETRLEAMAEAEGLPLAAIKVVSASRTTRTLNAYITGAGPSRELVLYDTLLDTMPDDEIEAVVAHELGHERRKHILLRTTVTALFLLFGLALLSRALSLAARRFAFDGPGDIRNLPVLFLLYALATLALRPASAAFSRYEERHADLAALEISANPAAMERMLLRVTRENRVDPAPGPLSLFWFASHPPVIERVGQARAAAAQARARGARRGKVPVGSSSPTASTPPPALEAAPAP